MPFGCKRRTVERAAFKDQRLNFFTAVM